LKTILDAESDANGDFVRNEKHALGWQVHRWLSEALGRTGVYTPFHFSERVKEELKGAASATERELEERFEKEGMALPLWWRSALRKAAWMGWGCLKPLAKLGEGSFFVAEYSLAREIETAEGGLRLEGRMDLALSDKAGFEGAAVLIIDFKTGRSAPPSMATLDQGKGFQFAAYYLMAKKAGAESVRVALINPTKDLKDVFGEGDEAELQRKIGALARVQNELDFGQAGPMNARWGACEVLPMATSWISARTLERKAALRES
jgi:hypothetical protein